MKKQDNLPPQMQEWLDQLHHYRDIYSYKPSPEEAAEVKLIGKQIRELRERAKLTMLGVKMLTGIDVALLQAVEIGIGDVKTAESVLKVIEKLVNKKKS